MSGRLVVIEGLDGCGKATQTRLLTEKLKECLPDVRTVSFPRYDSESSALVRAYLAGHFGSDPDAVNCYAASSFYSADRYLSYLADWGSWYQAGAVLVCDRSTTSNAVFQTPKLPASEWERYLDWLYDFEYVRLGLPKPDAVILLDLSVSTAEHMMDGRYGGDSEKRDIHERDRGYQQRCREAALYCAAHGGWQVVGCTDAAGTLRPAEAIGADIFSAVSRRLGL